MGELLDQPGVTFAILGDGESCTATRRRAGNEFLVQMLAQQNVETLNEARDEDRRDLRSVVLTRGC